MVAQCRFTLLSRLCIVVGLHVEAQKRAPTILGTRIDVKCIAKLLGRTSIILDCNKIGAVEVVNVNLMGMLVEQCCKELLNASLLAGVLIQLPDIAGEEFMLGIKLNAFTAQGTEHLFVVVDAVAY